MPYFLSKLLWKLYLARIKSYQEWVLLVNIANTDPLCSTIGMVRRHFTFFVYSLSFILCFWHAWCPALLAWLV